MGGGAVSATPDRAQLRAEAMRVFMHTMVRIPGWTLIGRQLYRRGTYGVFSLSVYSGRHAEKIAGLDGQYLSHEGGKDLITFRFADLLVPDPKVTHPNWRSDMQLHSDEDSWTWYMRPPKSLTPLHAAIDAWTAMFDSR